MMYTLMSIWAVPTGTVTLAAGSMSCGVELLGRLLSWLSSVEPWGVAEAYDRVASTTWR